jgi:hypothetical protein
LGFGISADAHHSDTAYDLFQPITLQGTVAKFLWENPHIRVYLDVRDADGKPAIWEVEGNPPGRIGGRGLKDALRPGDRITIRAYRARNPSHRLALGYHLTLTDGRRFIIGDDNDTR